jgi:recombination protein RecR
VQFSPLIQQLIEAFRVLPGVGPKTAQRMAFHVLERDKEGGRHLSEKLQESLIRVQHCNRCRILTELEICGVCQDKGRDFKVLCVVQSPSDVLAIEQAGGYRGTYFVLSGHLSPIDGIGPEDIGMPQLQDRLKEDIEEVVLATHATVEGEATAFYVSELVKRKGLKATRIAHGIPQGGDLEYIDANTLSRALRERKVI